MKTVFKIAIALVVIAIIAVSAIYVFIYNKPHPDFEKLKPVITLSASDLYNAYKANPDAANRKFTGSFIEITGPCAKTVVSDSLVIVTFIFEEGSDGPSGIRATVLPAYETRARQLSPGTYITVKGNCNGYTGSDVILEQCSLSK